MKYRLLLSSIFLLLLASFGFASAQDMTYTDSPFLKDQVSSGKLPPVAERLPKNPRVIDFPWSQPGTYGGDFRDPFVGDSYWASQMVFWTAWKSLVNWNESYSDWVPNIAEKVDVSDDAKSYTFHLREGLKWSDGVPFTSDDVVFYIDDILNNPELNSGNFPDGWLKPGKEAPTVKKIDDTSFTISFDVPYGMFLLNMCGWPGWEIVTAPKHYLQQFHDKYNHDGIADLIKQTEGATDWVTLFQAHSAVGPGSDAGVISRDVDYPTMMPWIYKEPLGTGTQFVAERNPYYYWVDKNGQQLPYIDRIVGNVYQNDETMLVDVLAGKYDTMANSTDQQRSLFFDNEATSGLSIYPTKSEGGGTVSINFNETNPDLGEIFSQKDFRIGMSYAIDRQEVIDIVYFGQGTPRQISPIEDSPLYNEQLSTQYLDFDVAKANEALDKVLPDKGADGMRLNPKTKEKLSIVFTVQTGDYGLRFLDVAELLKKYYAAVGVDIVIDSVDNAVLTDRINDNSVEAAIFTGWIDNIIQRLIEFTRSVPLLPIIIAIAALVPIDWSILLVYFIITLLLALAGWTDLARVVRGKFLSLREEDFVLAARLDGAKPRRLIFRHMLPSMYSHIIASLTLTIPGLIIAETALSYLGVGLRAPAVSWGVQLQEAQKINVISTYPWVMFPAFAVIIIVLAFNFLGDGLRDAADPY